MFAPSDLESAIMDHQSLHTAQCEKGRGRSWIDECDKADVLFRNISNVMQKAPTDYVAYLLNRRFWVNVTQVDGPVSQVRDTSRLGSHSRRRHRLLGKCVRYQIAVGVIEHVSVTRSNAEILCSILLLCLGDICTTIFAVINSARWLPLRFLRQLRYCLDGIPNRKKVNEADCFFLDNFDGINGPKLSKVLKQFYIGDRLREVAQVDVPGCPDVGTCEGFPQPILIS